VAVSKILESLYLPANPFSQALLNFFLLRFVSWLKCSQVQRPPGSISWPNCCCVIIVVFVLFLSVSFRFVTRTHKHNHTHTHTRTHIFTHHSKSFDVGQLVLIQNNNYQMRFGRCGMIHFCNLYKNTRNLES